MTRVRELAALYRSGVRRAGWCCRDCHATFQCRRGARREFAAMLAHKAIRHHKIPRLAPGTCHVTHSTDGGWTSTVKANTWTITWTNGQGGAA